MTEKTQKIIDDLVNVEVNKRLIAENRLQINSTTVSAKWKTTRQNVDYIKKRYWNIIVTRVEQVIKKIYQQ